MALTAREGTGPRVVNANRGDFEILGKRLGVPVLIVCGRGWLRQRAGLRMRTRRGRRTRCAPRSGRRRS